VDEEAAGAEISAADLDRLGAEWIERIKAAGDREKDWHKMAEEAEFAYLVDANGASTDGGNPTLDYNIVHSMVETIVPAVYNSTPKPDIRVRHQGSDEIAQAGSDVIERMISTQIDDSAMDGEVEKTAQDVFLAGRGITRVKYEYDEEMDKQAGFPVRTKERVIYDCVSWRDYREGPAVRWSDVPWVAFRHTISRADADEMQSEDIREARSRDKATTADDEEMEECLWEIWDKETQRVVFVCEEKCRVVNIVDDPMGLDGFFPMPEPVQGIGSTSKRTPVCPYAVYRSLALEMNEITRRIDALIEGIRSRGAYAGDAAIAAQISEAQDNELVPVGNLENLALLGNLTNAVWMWPIETSVGVLQQLYRQREETKQAIYEITGISDIVRGQGDPRETATAQSIKASWGSLRVVKMQKMIQRHVRKLMLLTAEIGAKLFSPQGLAMASGGDLPPEVEELVRSPEAYYRIDVETSSTIQADATSQREDMRGFMSATAEFFQIVAPLSQENPELSEPISEIYASFASQFHLGRAAEDALDKMREMSREKLKEMQGQPDPAKAAQEKADQMQQMAMQMEQGRFQLEQQRFQLEQQRFQFEVQQAQQASQQGAQKMQIDAMGKAKTAQQKDIELKLRAGDLELKAAAAKLADAQAEFDAIKDGIEIDMERDQLRAVKLGND